MKGKRMRAMLIVLVILMTASFGFADSGRESKTTIEFNGIGKLTMSNQTLLKGKKQMVLSQGKFKGKGFMGKMMGMFFPKDQTGTLLDLNLQKGFKIKYKKKQYTEFPIKPVSLKELGAKMKESEAVKGEPEKQKEDEKSDIRVIRSEVHVDKTGNTKQIAGYNASEFLLTWIFEFKNDENTKHYTDSLVAHVWTTKADGKLKQIQTEEQAFSREYLKLMGLDLDMNQQNMLGLKWVDLISKIQMSKGKAGATAPVADAKVKAQLEKISGYPLSFAGEFYLKDNNQSPDSESASGADEGMDLSNAKKAFGSLFGKKKKQKETPLPGGYKEILRYSMNTISLSTDPIADKKLSVPKGFELIAPPKSPF